MNNESKFIYNPINSQGEKVGRAGQKQKGIKGKYRIISTPENCTGCRLCQLACSELYEKEFNIFSAHISIQDQDGQCRIHFTEKCNGCGACTDTCFYGAIIKEKRN
jgi:Fe-S-cluster-containing hydrogenase component 2